MNTKFKARVAAETLSDDSIVFNVLHGSEILASPATQQEAELIAEEYNTKHYCSKADKRARDMGAEDKRCNNIDPTYRGKVEINDETFDVINAAVFSGILHFGILGTHGVTAPENVCGWVPACVCNIPD